MAKKLPPKYDGCSGGMSRAWRTLLGSPPPWESCCDEHDQAYARGGTARERRLADSRLLACVAFNGHPVWAIIMWAAVRLGGWPYFPARWRWGFRRRYGAGYRP